MMKRKAGTLTMAKGDGHDKCRENVRELEAALSEEHESVHSARESADTMLTRVRELEAFRKNDDKMLVLAEHYIDNTAWPAYMKDRSKITDEFNKSREREKETARGARESS
jgi:hypothetical protein